VRGRGLFRRIHDSPLLGTIWRVKSDRKGFRLRRRVVEVFVLYDLAEGPTWMVRFDSGNSETLQFLRERMERVSGK
jgi:hypothetical protein